LIERRRTIGAGTKGRDKTWNLLFWPLMVACQVVAGLGVRYRCQAPSLPPAWGSLRRAEPLGVGDGARIQKELGHRVIDSAPYRVVRHPGYVGLSLCALGMPSFMLLSWVALAPAGAVLLWVALRNALVDRMLRREQDGHEDYARRVRFRLVPGVF
jgi:hypothetical protein